MLEKNKAKLERKNRKMWTGLYTRKTPTKKEKIRKIEKKYKESAIKSAPYYYPIEIQYQKSISTHHIDK